MASLNQKILEMIEILLPERDIQDKIVSILSVIDEKIKSNTRINDNIIAKVVFEDLPVLIEQLKKLAENQ